MRSVVSKKYKLVKRNDEFQVKAGYSDATIAPELVSDTPRISSPSENIQRITPEEAKLLQEIAGNPNVTSIMDSGEHYINPVHLRPELEAVINRQRMNRDIPNNGPFTAESANDFKRYAQDIVQQNQQLIKLCKTLIEQKQMLIRDRAELMNEQQSIRNERIYAEKQTKISKVVQLMQRKGLVDQSEQAYASKVNELMTVDDNSLLQIINLVRQVPSSVKLAQKNYYSEPEQGTPVLFFPDKTNNDLSPKQRLQSELESFPWGTTGHR